MTIEQAIRVHRIVEEYEQTVADIDFCAKSLDVAAEKVKSIMVKNSMLSHAKELSDLAYKVKKEFEAIVADL